MIVNFFLIQSKSSRKINKKLNKNDEKKKKINSSNVFAITRKIKKHTNEHNFFLHDSFNYEVSCNRDRKKKFTKFQKNFLVRYVLINRRNRKRIVDQHIDHLKFQCSIFIFQIIMYRHDVCRRESIWKSILNEKNKQKRFTFAHKWKHFDFKTRAIFTDEFVIKKSEMRNQYNDVLIDWCNIYNCNKHESSLKSRWRRLSQKCYNEQSKKFFYEFWMNCFLLSKKKSHALLFWRNENWKTRNKNAINRKKRRWNESTLRRFSSFWNNEKKKKTSKKILLDKIVKYETYLKNHVKIKDDKFNEKID